MFADFFDELDEQFAAEDLAGASASAAHWAGPRPALASLFRKVFLAEFALLNPLRDVGDAERHCLARLQTALRPFGQLPAKITLQLGRAFRAWKGTVRALERASLLLIGLADKLRLSRECSAGLTRLRQCHVCAGASAETRPCSGHCLNVLRGCFAEIAELEPQWTGFLGECAFLDCWSSISFGLLTLLFYEKVCSKFIRGIFSIKILWPPGITKIYDK